MTLLELLQQNSFALYSVTAVLGLMVGSFLNVVIHRLPIMMEQEWREECTALNNAAPLTKKTFNLISPRSQCPGCGSQIKAWQNIPVVSFLFLKGRCVACSAKISWQYPLVELLTAILSIIVVMHFGWSVQALAALLLTWALISLSVIDLKEMILPDKITLPMIWVGLLLSLFVVFTEPQASILGAVCGYLSLWSVYHVFKWLTKKDGMGYGDFKLLALLGAWLGWQSLPLLIILSAFAGSVIGIGMIVFLGRDRQIPIPFGPYLAIAGWVTLLWGEPLRQAYFQLLA